MEIVFLSDNFKKVRIFLDDLIVQLPYAEVVRHLWEELQDKISDLPVPAIWVNNDRKYIIMCWSHEKYYAELEVDCNENFGWFFTNRISHKFCGSEENDSGPIDNKFIELLRSAVIELN